MMPILKRVLKILMIILLAIILLGGAGGYWFVAKSHPQISGTLRVSGLKSQVEIVRDPLGVPHIYASNADDLFFTQGYVQAQDRLWQMELFRHVGAGRTAELSGRSGTSDDKFLRTLGIPRAARAYWENANEEEKRVLNAFAAGVNAFIDSHRDNLPIEYALIGITPEPWQPVDSAAWAKIMALDLGGNRTQELVRARLREKLGSDRANELMPGYPAQGPFIIPPEAKEYKAESPNHLVTESPVISLGNPNFEAIAAIDSRMTLGDGIGSNNWVVDGTKTVSGKPMLANDPHLGIQMPSIWYEIGLHCQPIASDCAYNVVGMAFAPSPTVVIGHNDRIAWGITNTNPDVQDYFVEKINPQNPNQYEYQGKWEDFTIESEIVKIKGGGEETFQVKISRHGPIMTPVLEGITQPLSLQWTAVREPSHVIDSILRLDRARDWSEFRDALRFFDAPSQNFVYADVDGNIGYQMPGNIPIRAKGDGSVPVPGWTGEYEWTGYVPFGELPSVYNPPNHFIATANNQVVPSTYKYLITNDWSAPYRAMRINELLASKQKFSIQDFQTMQADITSIPLERLQRNIVGFTFEKEKFLPTRALEFAIKWNGRLDIDSVGGSILQATYLRAMKNILAGRLDGDLMSAYLDLGVAPRAALLALLDQPNSVWWDDLSTSQKETRDDILKKSFEQGVDDLGRRFGDAPAEWKWGRMHTATFGHPIGSVQPLNLLFNIGPLATNGDGYTVNNGGYRDSRDFTQRTVSSMRMIHDLSDWSRSIQMHTTGQSGQPLNKHYCDLVMPWRDVRHSPLYFDRTHLEKVT
jgi:penicillin amidase